MNRFPSNCDRCHEPMKGSIMSKFNQDIICIPCKKDEEQAPGYKDADTAEVAAVRRGERNFPGVGLSAEDRAFLTGRLKERQDEAAMAKEHFEQTGEILGGRLI